MKYSLKNKIATYSLLGSLIFSPVQSYALNLPFFGKKETKKQELKIDETRREKTVKYLEKKPAPLPEIVIPGEMKDDSTFTSPVYGIVEKLKPYIQEQDREYFREELANAEINFSRNRQELTDIASQDSVTADSYYLYSTPRTDICPKEELPLLYDAYRNVEEQANQGDETAIELKKELDKYFIQLENNARIANAVRRSLDQIITPIEKKANSSWIGRHWYIPTVAAATVTGLIINAVVDKEGTKVEGGRYGEPGVY